MTCPSYHAHLNTFHSFLIMKNEYSLRDKYDVKSIEGEVKQMIIKEISLDDMDMFKGDEWKLYLHKLNQLKLKMKKYKEAN